MELVLLWLDELDDLVFAGFSLWARLRRSCLAIGLIAAVSLHLLLPFGFSIDQVLSLLYVALASVAGWFLIAAFCARMERNVRSASQPA